MEWIKEETFAPKCTKENMVIYNVQVDSGKREESLKQKVKIVDWKQQPSSLIPTPSPPPPPYAKEKAALYF